MSDSNIMAVIDSTRRAERYLRTFREIGDDNLCQLLQSLIAGVRQLAGDQNPVGDPAPPAPVPYSPPVVPADPFAEFEQACVGGFCACCPAECPICGCNALWDIRGFPRVHDWRCSRCQQARFTTPWRPAGECERQAKIFLADFEAGKANADAGRWARSLLEIAAMQRLSPAQ